MNSFAKILSVLLLTSAVPAFADIQVGVVDIERALAATKAGGEAQKQFEGQLKRAQTGIDSKKGELQRQREALEKQKDSLNGKALAEKQDAILSMEKELKRNFEDKQDELRRERGRLFGELVKKMRKVIEELGASDGYSVILERSGQSVLYVSSAVDVTDKVVKKFDAAE